MNFLDLSAASEEERRLIREILSDTSVVNIAEPLSSSQPFKTNSQTHQQQINFSSNSNNCQNTISNLSNESLAASQNHHRSNNHNNSSSGNNNNSSQQRKNIHNSNNINSIGNVSGINRNNGLQNSGNVASNVNNIHQQHYPRQYLPPPPSSDPSSTPHFHNINVNNINTTNVNNHTSSNSSLNSQLNQQQQHHNQRANNGQTSERLRNVVNSNSGNISHTNANNHINSNSGTNIAVTSSSGLTPIGPNLDQHHGNTMPLNLYNHHATPQLHHQVPTRMQTAKSDHISNNLKNSQPYQDTSTSMQSATTGAQSVPPTAQMPAIAGDMNSVIGMDMASTQPQGYSLSPQLAAFASPHQIYQGQHIFHQPYHYLIPYHTYMPYVLPHNSVVSPRQQIPPQPNQAPNINTSSNSHPRPHLQLMSQQQHSHEQYNTLNNTNNNLVSQQQSNKTDNAIKRDVNSSHQSQNIKKNYSEREQTEIQKTSAVIKTSTKSTNSQNDDISLPQKTDKTKKILQGVEPPPEIDSEIKAKLSFQESDASCSDKATKVAPNSRSSNVIRVGGSQVPKSRIVPNAKVDSLVQKAELESPSKQPDSTNSRFLIQDTPVEDCRDSAKHQDGRFYAVNHRSNGDDPVKVSSDEGFDTQSSLDLSKRSQDSTLTTNDGSKSSPEDCNKIVLKQTPQELSESGDTKSTEAPSSSTGAWAPSKSWADLFKRGGDTLPSSSVDGEVEHNSGSENSDDDNRNHRLVSSMRVDTISRVGSQGGNSKERRSQEIARRASDKMALMLAQKISSLNLKHALPFLRPRGFINKGNGCYINATLQALIACPPFYNLMKEIGDLKVTRRDNSCTPILDSFADFFLNFPPLDSNKKNKQLSTSQDQKTHISTIQAEAIEPKCIYNVLGQIKSECLKGAQEDAEEFLSSVLNGLHEEMIGLSEVMQSVQDSNTRNAHHIEAEDINDDIANDDNLWREVGSKNRSLPIRTAKVINTPIQEIFGGSLFSIRTAGKDRCGHRSPFFDLQLDISGDNVKSVQDAIKSFTATEIIHDFYCSKTKQKLDAQRRTSLDQLPPILILHLKQFVYTPDHGLKKLIKKIEYPIDFELPENCLHEKNSMDRNLLTSRSYKLLAVVYHDGKEAIKGHYLTDVYHIGSSQWIRCDDSNLKVIPSPRIENPESSRTPYLLFYRRLNTLRAQTGNHDNKKKN